MKSGRLCHNTRNFYQKNSDISSKLWKMLFISFKKLFLLSKYWIFCNFGFSFSHFPDSGRYMKVEYLMMSWIGLHKLADVMFAITQNCIVLHHQTWSSNTSLIEAFFCTCFVTWRATDHWSLITRPLLFFVILSIKRGWVWKKKQS